MYFFLTFFLLLYFEDLGKNQFEFTVGDFFIFWVNKQIQK